MLQVVLERLTGRTLEELMKEKIFGPYGMTTSSYTWQPRFEANYCHGHDEAGKVLEKDKDNAARPRAPWRRRPRTTRASCARSSTARPRRRRPEGDVHHADPHPLEERSSVLWPNEDVPGRTTRSQLGYGLGWGVLKTPHGVGAFKEGHGDGFEHYSIVFPDRGIGVLLMSNSANGESIFKELLELTIADTFTPWQWQNYVPYPK